MLFTQNRFEQKPVLKAVIIMQNIIIEIPKEIVLSLKIPGKKTKDQLKEELAIHLYRKGFLSFGKA